MPQLGESVTEGTIIKWYKKVGDSVSVDEVLFDVSTDKVDTEVPSPAGGVVEKILIDEGETVEVGTILAVISDSIESDGSINSVSDTANRNQFSENKNGGMMTNVVETPLKLNMPVGGVEAVPPPPPPPKPVFTSNSSEQSSAVELNQKFVDSGNLNNNAPSDEKHVVSPIVRNLMADNRISLDEVSPTGIGNRITLDDVKAAVLARSANGSIGSKLVKDNVVTKPGSLVTPFGAKSVGSSIADDEFVEFNNIRRLTADHMLQSKHVAPHSSIITEVDFEAVEKARHDLSHKHSIGQEVHLTYLPFVARATVEALKMFPKLNASVAENGLIIHKHINLGFGVDLNFEGLVVPVIHDADQYSVTGLASVIFDLASRARSKKLSVDELVGGTFTISNPGPYHTMLTIPIINQPEVGILATDSVKRKAVVVDSGTEEYIGIHSIGLIGITFDHRAIDGAYAAKFVSTIADMLSSHDWDGEI